MSDEKATVFDLLKIPGASARRRGEVRVSLKNWRGRDSLDVRWWASPDGGKTFRPTIRGASVPIAHLPALLQAVREAVEILKAESEAKS